MLAAEPPRGHDDRVAPLLQQFFHHRRFHQLHAALSAGNETEGLIADMRQMINDRRTHADDFQFFMHVKPPVAFAKRS